MKFLFYILNFFLLFYELKGKIKEKIVLPDIQGIVKNACLSKNPFLKFFLDKFFQTIELIIRIKNSLLDFMKYTNMSFLFVKAKTFSKNYISKYDFKYNFKDHEKKIYFTTFILKSVVKLYALYKIIQFVLRIFN